MASWMGFSPRRSGTILVAIQGLYCLVGLSGWYFAIPDGVLFTAWSLVAVAHFMFIRRSWVIARWVKHRFEPGQGAGHGGR